MPPPPRSTLFPYTTLFRSLRVAHADPNQLERSVIGFLVNRRAEVEHQAGLLEATLEEVALGTGDMSALIAARSEEHTSELQSRRDLVCRLLRVQKKTLDHC